ncbi:pentatricopeptide repeat-containing protein At5g66520-like [Tripterygium wilfordii]|uniref:pentatricopeptide repeat-containing protein At5g66520-like n=1 Tax=Tripterygium wilfordii TaxID=458696 RepID=UPI0018F855A8|nr:pentatricopeptide repeat-containing protein At5g66520-like [Tripterygium wilfordii]
MLKNQPLSLRNTISYLIRECKSTRQLQQIHTQIIALPNFSQNDYDFLIKRLLFSCALSDSRSYSYAEAIFLGIDTPTLSAYNIMIRAYASRISDHGDSHSCECVILYKRMFRNGIAPDCLTLPFLLKECTRRLDSCLGRSIHGQAVKFGLYNNVYVQNSLIGLYMTCGFLKSGHKLFEEMLDRDVVSWNSMIIGYLRYGNLDIALALFQSMEMRNIITWNSIITGFVQGGRPKEALEFFREMQSLQNDMVKPDKITIASALTACAYLGAIDHGKWVHSYLRRSGLEFDTVIGTALVDMYGKCGFVERAYEVFKEMPKKDTLAWTAMISVFASHGLAKEAFDLLKEMVAEGVKPNHVTFVSLLSACAHSGLVETGRWCFNTMRAYSIEPQAHHYACMVDILGRSGLFQEAEDIIRSMPLTPDLYVWGALLGACQMHGNIELGEKVAQYLINMEPNNHAFYVNLIDIYGKAGRYVDVKRIRKLMEGRGIKKEVAGCSMIEVDGVVHEFSVGGPPEMVVEEELTHALNQLSKEVRIKGNLDGNGEISLDFQML